jgi:hypothetical protein
MRRDNPALKGTDTALDEKRGSSQRIEATLEKISKNICMSVEKSIVIYFTYAGMFENRFTVYEVMKFSIHGKRSMRHRPITIIFGTKTRVISCICVAAWKILTRRPTIIVANNIGPIKMIAVFKNSLKIWTIRS